MADELSQTLSRLQARCEAIELRCAAIKEENARLGSLAEMQKEQIDRLSIELQQSRLDNEYLRVSHKIAPSAADVKEAKAMLAGLIRQIDKCIARLKE